MFQKTVSEDHQSGNAETLPSSVAVLGTARSPCSTKQRPAQLERFANSMLMPEMYRTGISDTVKCKECNLKLYLLRHRQPV